MDKLEAGPLKLKIKEFIKGVRSSPGALDRGLNWDPWHMDVFHKSTQAIVLQFRAPDLALLVFMTRPEKEDLDVEFAIDMPLSAVAEDLPKKLQKCEQISFKEAIGDGQVSLVELLERETKSLLQNAIRYAVFDQTGFGFYPPKSVALFRYPGVAADMDVPSVLEREYARAQVERARQYGTQVFFSRTGRARTVFAGRFRKIEEPGRAKTFKESLVELLDREENPWCYWPPFWKCFYKKVELTIFSSGVVVADTSHQHLALKSLNSFFAASDFQGVNCMPTTSPHDLGHVDIDEHGALSSYGGRVMLSRNLSTTASVAESSLKDCIAFFDEAQKDSETLEQLRLRHSAGIHFMAGEYLQSFMLAWTVIEREIRRLWAMMFEKRQMDRKRKDKLITEDNFTTNQLIEVTELLGGLDTRLYIDIQKLRRVRNDTVHRGTIPTCENCGECIKIANTFIHKKCPRIRSGMSEDPAPE
jgi:hypothetical protein